MSQLVFRELDAGQGTPRRHGRALPAAPVGAFFVLLLGCFAASAAHAEHRAALLIGNAGHAGAPVLASPAKDIQIVATVLRKHGFRTTLDTDLDRDELYRTVDRFISAAPIKGTALIYFSGYVRYVPDAERGQLRLLGTDGNGKGLPLSELADWLFLHSATAQNVIVLDGCGVTPSQSSVRDLADAKNLSANIWLCDAARADNARVSRRLSAFAEAISTSEKRNLGSLLRAACGWTKSTCRKPPFSENATRAVAAPNEFPRVANPGDEWVAPDGTVFCYCPPPAGGSGFWIGKYEVPLCKWGIPKQNAGIGVRRNDPTTQQPIKEVFAKLATLNTMERRAGRLPLDWEYALPSPEQWEHAARAGTAGDRYFEDRDLFRNANFADRSLLDTGDDFYLYANTILNDGAARLTAVGSYLPNAWGLHDVYGNVWEQTDTGVLCGGGWTSPPDYCRATVRKSPLRLPCDFVGLRIVVRPVSPLQQQRNHSLR